MHGDLAHHSTAQPRPNSITGPNTVGSRGSWTYGPHMNQGPHHRLQGPHTAPQRLQGATLRSLLYIGRLQGGLIEVLSQPDLALNCCSVDSLSTTQCWRLNWRCLHTHTYSHIHTHVRTHTDIYTHKHICVLLVKDDAWPMSYFSSPCSFMPCSRAVSWPAGWMLFILNPNCF